MKCSFDLILSVEEEMGRRQGERREEIIGKERKEMRQGERQR